MYTLAQTSCNRRPWLWRAMSRQGERAASVGLPADASGPWGERELLASIAPGYGTSAAILEYSADATTYGPRSPTLEFEV